MKIKYTDFVSEALNSVNFSDEYNAIRESLEDFWALLTDKIEEFSEINSRNLQDVVNFNQNARKQRNQPAAPTTPNKPPAKQVKQPVKPAGTHHTTRPLSRKDTPTLIKMFNNPQYKNQRKEIRRILDERNIKANKTQQAIKNLKR